MCNRLRALKGPRPPVHRSALAPSDPASWVRSRQASLFSNRSGPGRPLSPLGGGLAPSQTHPPIVRQLKLPLSTVVGAALKGCFQERTSKPCGARGLGPSAGRQTAQQARAPSLFACAGLACLPVPSARLPRGGRRRRELLWQLRPPLEYTVA